MPHDWMTPFALCHMTAWHHSVCALWLYVTVLTMRHNCKMTPLWLYPMNVRHHFVFATWLHDTILTLPHDCMTLFYNTAWYHSDYICTMAAWHHSDFATWLHDTIRLCNMTAWHPSTILHDIILTMHHDWLTPFWLCHMPTWNPSTILHDMTMIWYDMIWYNYAP